MNSRVFSTVLDQDTVARFEREKQRLQKQAPDFMRVTTSSLIKHLIVAALDAGDAAHA